MYVWIVYAVILYVYSFCVGASGRFCAPLSVPAQSAGTPPPQGEASVPASIAAKFVVRKSRRNVYLTTKYPSIYGRALGSPCGGAGAKRLRGGTKKRPFPDALCTRIIFVKMNIHAARKKTAVPAGTAAAACRGARSVFGFTRGSRSRCRGPRSSWRRRSS